MPERVGEIGMGILCERADDSSTGRCETGLSLHDAFGYRVMVGIILGPSEARHPWVCQPAEVGGVRSID